MYTMVLSDGTRLENLALNGNNFIANSIIDDTVFCDNLSKVTIVTGDVVETYNDMRLLANRVIDGKTWFVIGEKSEAYRQRERIAALEEENKNLREALDLLLSGATEEGDADG